MGESWFGAPARQQRGGATTEPGTSAVGLRWGQWPCIRGLIEPVSAHHREQLLQAAGFAAVQPRRNHRNGPWLDGRKPTAFSRLRPLCAAAARGGIGHLSEIWQQATVIEAVEAEGSAGVV